MTHEEVQKTLRANRAVFRGAKDGVQWYWSPVRQAWIGMTGNQVAGFDLRLVASSACNCG